MTSSPIPPPERATVQVRRAPKIPAFMVVGGLVGLLIVLIVTPLFPADQLVGLPALIGYFSLFGITFGVTAGALIALGFEWRSRRRARVLEAERETVDPDPVEAVIDDEPGESEPQP